MDILYLLIPVAMIIVVLMAVAFLWSVKSGQMDDLEGPAFRVLMDDDGIQKKQEKSKVLNEKNSKKD